jgi:hypothetical protein
MSLASIGGTVSSITSLPGTITDPCSQVQDHPALYRNVSGGEAEKILENQPPFTFIFRAVGEKNSYAMSFVQTDCSVAHRAFVLDPERLKWLYKNDYIHVEARIQALIPQMMHCTDPSCPRALVIKH